MNNKDLLNKEERKKGAKSLIIIFSIMFFTYLIVWFVWTKYEGLLNEFKVLPTLQIEKSDWVNIYSNKKIFETSKGNIEVDKIDETNYVIKYKDKVFHERAFRYFNVREFDNAILISFPSFFMRGIKNILITNNTVYEFFKIPIDLQDEYDEIFAQYLIGKNKEINFSDLPINLKNRIKNGKITINSKYTRFILEDINKVYKLSEDSYLFVKNPKASNYIEYYYINAEEENREEKNYILRMFLMEK